MKTPARVIPGALTKANEGACDWGWSSNLLAFGCQSAVVVFMPKSTQIIQVRRPDIIADFLGLHSSCRCPKPKGHVPIILLHIEVLAIYIFNCPLQLILCI